MHFGAPTFSKELESNLISQIQYENPDFIIFAGDATDHGYVTEYNDAAVFVDELKATSEVHSIPGNHDVRNVGILHFQRLIGERHFVRVDKKAGFAIIGLDSSQADVNSGDIGHDQMNLKKYLIIWVNL
ncbi:MAG: metallophosphoesterase [Methanobacterium sp.]